MALRLQCPCGEVLIAKDEDEMVALARDHLRRQHPDLVEEYTREQILFMATAWPDR